MANLALLGDKSLIFSNGRDAMLMYGVEGRSWVALGDPLGPDEPAAELAWRFREAADEHGGWPVYYEVTEKRLALYIDLGLSLLKLGEEAVVPLTGFSLDGPDRRGLRRTQREFAKRGASFEVLPREHVADMLPTLQQVSDDWLHSKATREKGFSLGRFDAAYLRHFPVAVVREAGHVVAFSNIWAGAPGSQLSMDLMRYSTAASSGVMEYLVIELLLWGHANGYAEFSLGMAPLSGLQDRALASLWNRAGHWLFRHGENFYNFQGLRQYKEKFDPVWRPRYLASPGGLALPRILTNVATLVSGGVKGIVAK
jgi:phosphatidylglycerol lysyltransferase